jgi:hypothetical protein
MLLKKLLLMSVSNCRTKQMQLSSFTLFLCRIVGLRNCSLSIIKKGLVELSILGIRTPIDNVIRLIIRQDRKSYPEVRVDIFY